MGDKARTTFPISLTFAEGELPAPAKLTGLASQAKSGLGILEYMVGDTWHQSGDSLLNSVTDAPLMIANLARFLGAARLANPRIPYLPNIENYTHVLSGFAGQREFQLPFPPAGGSSYTWSGTSTPSGAPQANKEDVDAIGEWWIDTATGQVVTYDACQADWTVEYTPVVAGDIGSEATWNIIPDPDTDSSYAFQGLKLEYVNGTDDSDGYYIFLPPRMPLDTRRLEISPHEDAHAPTTSANFQALPATGDRLFWQSDAVGADTSSNAEHYRYLLPKLITDNWSQAVTLPAGLIYLYDPINTKTIIEGLLFYAENAATPRKYVLVAKGANLTSWISTHGSSAYSTANLQSTSHAPSLYPSTGLRLVTVGSSLAALVSSLLSQFFNHDHSNSHSIPGRAIQHNKLDGLYANSGGTVWSSSRLDNDDHPQYLHRDAGDSRDRYGNAILGSLRIASTNSASSYNNLNSQSKSLMFGSNVGPGLQFSTYLGSGSGQLVMNCFNVGLGRNFPLVAHHSTDGNGNPLGEIWASTFRDTPHYHSTYGHSAGSSSSGYGTVRKHVIQGNRFYYWTDATTKVYNISSTTFEYVDDQPSLLVQGALLPGKFAFRINYASGGNYRWYFAPILIPHDEFAIVNVSTRIYPRNVPLAANKIDVYLSRVEPDTTSYSFSASVDLNTVWPAAAALSWTSYSDLFAISTTTPLLTVSSGQQAGFVIRMSSDADTNGLYMDAAVVKYRVKEF